MRVKILFNKKENALVQMTDSTQAQLGNQEIVHNKTWWDVWCIQLVKFVQLVGQVESESLFCCLCALQAWVTWTASGCTGSLCGSRCPNTPVFSFPAKVTKTRAWPKTTAAPPCTASRSLALRTTPTFSHLLPPYTSPISRELSSGCARNQVLHLTRNESAAVLTSVLFVLLVLLWLKRTSRCCFPVLEPWLRLSNSSSKLDIYWIFFSWNSFWPES